MAEQLRETLVINQILKCGLDIFNLNTQNNHEYSNRKDNYENTDEISFTLSSEEHLDDRKDLLQQKQRGSIERQQVGKQNNKIKPKKWFQAKNNQKIKESNQNINLKKELLGHDSLYKQLYLSAQKKQNLQAQKKQNISAHKKQNLSIEKNAGKNPFDKYEIKTPEKTFQKGSSLNQKKQKNINKVSLFQRYIPLTAIKNQSGHKKITPYSQKITQNIYGRIKTQVSSFTVNNQPLNKQEKRQINFNKQKKWEQFLIRDKQWRERRNSNVMFKKVQMNVKIDKETKKAAQQSLHNKYSHQKTSKSRLSAHNIDTSPILSKSVINKNSTESSVQICLNKLKVQTEFLKIKLLQHPSFINNENEQGKLSSKSQQKSNQTNEKKPNSKNEINEKNQTKQNLTKRLVRNFINKSQKTKQRQKESDKHIKKNKEIQRYLGLGSAKKN